MTEDRLIAETDPAGLETLKLFANTGRYNSWLFETLAPFCKDNLLEIGSGIGNISGFLIQRYSQVFLSDLRQEYCELLQKKFVTGNVVKEIYLFDLGEKDFEKKYPQLQTKFDTVLASNVVEHIEDDSMAIGNCHKLLSKRGHAVVLVPAHQWLYNSFDKELGHYRRYTKKKLRTLLEKEGFNVIHTQYFNAAGIFGWWFSGTVLKKKILPQNQLILYNRLIPLIRFTDKMLLHKCGLSVIAVGEKK